MKPFARPAALAAVAVAALLAAPGPAQEKPRPADPPKKPTVMQRKLAHAQKLLEGLALEDFDRIRTSADGLLECVKDASWRINETDKYVVFSNEFLRTVQTLQKAGKDKKVDAAALAYVDMTLTCVKCHRYLRDERIGAAPDLSPLVPKVVAEK
jgi:hypothetical protein